MGVKGFWKIVAEAAEQISLEALTIAGHRDSDSARNFVIGIDASTWIYEVAHPFLHSHVLSGRNPELRTLFYRLARLSKLPVIVLFVFDGPGRPDRKRNKRVKLNNSWIVDDFQDFIIAFGFYFHTAPGEAEAELASFNRAGLVDVVFTVDSDALIFGAKKVIRYAEDGDSVLCYSADRIVDILHLRESGLFLMPILRGGDYDTKGLVGCGVQVASQLAVGGFGDSLLQAVRGLDDAALRRFLVKWRCSLRTELEKNTNGLLKCCHASLARNVPESFPKISVLQKYGKPTVTALPLQRDHPLRNLLFSRIDVKRVSVLCRMHFNWGKEGAPALMSRFEKVLWPGVITRMMLMRKIMDGERTGLYRALRLLPPQLNYTGNTQQTPISTHTVNLLIDSVALEALITSDTPSATSISSAGKGKARATAVSRARKRCKSARSSTKVPVLEYVVKCFNKEVASEDDQPGLDDVIDLTTSSRNSPIAVPTNASQSCRHSLSEMQPVAGPSSRPYIADREVIDLLSDSDESGQENFGSTFA